MTQTIARGRHRAACKPLTPLTAFGEAVTGNAARRGFVVAATSGLAISMAATNAVAAPESSALPQVDVSAVSAEARSFLAVSPTISVSADATFSIADVSTNVTPAKSLSDADVDPLVARANQIEEARQIAIAQEAAAARTTAQAASRTTVRAEAETTAATATEVATTQAAAPAQVASGNEIIDIAFRYVGTPYAYGGASPSGFDCSGFTWYVFQQLGISIPRSSAAQRNAGTVVSAAEAQPGDLVWWSGHVGIYTGNGNHIAARNSSKPLQAGPISDVGRGEPVYIRVTG